MLLCSVTAFSQTDDPLIGDWKRTTNHWDSNDERWVPVIEIIRISESDSGRYYISGKVVNASDGTTRSYMDLGEVRYTNNELFYSDDWRFQIHYYKLSFDGNVATRHHLYILNKVDGDKYTINRVDGEYYRNNDNW